ncbi:DUF2905 domain-containing protein [candidate division KSB1 bacterium]|nr:DUF2905 domain-containing protein [candidate division KSB1 bacterium]
MQKIFIILGIILIIIGLNWPWLSKIPLGRLPGDIVINKPQIKIYFPITSMIILSVLISFLLWLFRK